MNAFSRACLLLIAISGLAGCGGGTEITVGKGSGGGSEGSGQSGTSVTRTSERYTYAYDYNGCKTGKQSATSREDYCRNLADHALNGYCAEWIRKDAFEKGCGGAGVEWESSTIEDSRDADGVPTAEQVAAE